MDVVAVRRQGRRVACYDWGGAGPPVVLLHPAGFCAGLFGPLAAEIAGVVRPVALDLPGHGRSEALPDGVPLTFTEAAHDAAAVLSALGIERPLVVGMSFGGGVAVLLAELLGELGVPPVGVVLAEAIVVDVATEPAGPGSYVGGRRSAAAAARWRAVFPSRVELDDHLRTRRPFAEFTPAVRAAYAAAGTRPRPDGSVELCCHPDDEARAYLGSWHSVSTPAAWAALGRLSCPTVVAAGAESHLPRRWFEQQAARIGVPLQMARRHHLFGYEDPAAFADLILPRAGSPGWPAARAKAPAPADRMRRDALSA
ncbi:alpha/beta hydrolase [Frankia sp. Cas3]|uniref:alpha/beta fold hydrolase n=1 Tax=Frankia sp. Cas3 TaxID=3073926 RepID=UPI002AD39A11|nr:alpha/beta hydrolase [Frankia sp. Cas3]